MPFVYAAHRRELCSRAFDREADRLRNRVERFFHRLKPFRRIATRFEKRAENYEAMIYATLSLVMTRRLARL